MCKSNQFPQQLIAQIRNSDILIKPQRRLYIPGETVVADVKGMDGRSCQRSHFTIIHSPGSGFAGQVYRAQTEDGRDPVAIKVLRPASTWKERFRDTLFRLSFQAPFAPRLTEEAVRTGLIWQTLLRIGAEIEWGMETAVVQPLGYYWDEELCSFVEVHEWVDGRAARFSADEQLLRRLFGRTSIPSECEMRRQRCFMARLAQLCRQMGAAGLARQYEWYTFVSQANVLRRHAPKPGQSEFVAVDFRPGLAVPFFLPLSPHHARLIVQGLRRGVLRHFDEVDLTRLDRYTAEHHRKFAPFLPLIEQLKKDETHYRDGLPDLWHHPTHLRERTVKTAVSATWLKAGIVSEGESGQLNDRAALFYFYFLLDHVPLVGHFLLCLWGNGVCRRHWQQILRNRDYRKDFIIAFRARDLLEWQQTGRVSKSYAPDLAQALPRYWWNKFMLSWQPSLIHRLFTDRVALRQWLYDRFLFPLRLLFQPAQRQIWLRHIIAEQVKNGVVSHNEETILLEQVCQPLMHGFLRDLGLTAGLDLFAKALSISLAYYGLTRGNFLPFLVVSFGPISFSGLIRAGYVLLQLIGNLPQIFWHKDRKLLLARLLGLTIAPWRAVGNLFSPVEMFTYYPQLSVLVADYLTANMVDALPVLGGRGKLLSYWAFQISYNLPLSIRHSILGARKK